MRNKRYHRGFTIVELLIALAITAILLTAIAVAFNASIINYTENQNIFKAINNARQALSRITTEVRTGFVDTNISDPTRCEVWCDDDSTVPYHTYYLVPYVDENGQQKNKLKLHVSNYPNNATNPLDPSLCDNVADMTFNRTVVTPLLPKLPYVESVQISMTVAIGDVRQTVSAAAVVRKVLN